MADLILCLTGVIFGGISLAIEEYRKKLLLAFTHFNKTTSLPLGTLLLQAALVGSGGLLFGFDLVLHK